MGFVKFTNTNARTGDPIVSIWSRSGQIRFNQRAIQEFNIKNYQYIILYFDSDNRRIGFELTKDKEAEGAIELKRRNKDIGILFHALPFLRINKINHKEAKRYYLKQDKESNLLIANINDQGEKGNNTDKSNKRRKNR